MRVLAFALIVITLAPVRGAAEPQATLELTEYRISDVKALEGAAILATPDHALIAGGLGGRNVGELALSDEGTGELRAVGQLSTPRGWAAAVTVDDAQLLIGGTDGERLLRSVIRLDWSDGTLVETALPELEIGLAFAGAGVIDDDVYVVGGTTGWPDWSASDRVFRLSLQDVDRGWSELARLPAGPVVRPAVSGQFGELHVIGGWRRVTSGSKSTSWRASSEAWGYRAIPFDGGSEKGWRELAELPVPLAGAVALASGQAHLLVLGGASGASKRPIPNSTVFAFHNVTDTWVSLGALSENSRVSAGARVDESYLLYTSAGSDLSLIELEIDTPEIGLTATAYAVIVLYFVVIAGIGVYFARRQKSSEVYALGGRNIRWWAAGMSMFATGASSLSFMATPAIVFTSNLVFIIPLVVTTPLAFLLHGWIFYPLLRRLELTSTYEFLHMRFNEPLRLLAGLQFMTFHIFGRMSVVLLLPALAMSAVTGLDVMTSVILMGVLTTIYTSVGGFEAVVWTDVTQGALMVLGMCVMIALAITGLPDGFQDFLSIGSRFQKFEMTIMSSDYSLPIIHFFLVQAVFHHLMQVGDQPSIQRVFATPTRDVVKLSAATQTATFSISLIAALTGLSIFAFFHTNPQLLSPVMENDQVVPLYIVQRLPGAASGLIIAALFAASMSTVSSSMNSVATVINSDFVPKLAPGISDRQQLVVMRVASLAAGAIGTGIALYMASLEITSMFEIWNEVWALLGGGFIGMYMLGIFTRRANSIGVIVGALASVVVTALTSRFTEVHYMFLNPVAILTCIGVGYAVSLLTPGNRKADLTGLTVWNLR